MLAAVCHGAKDLRIEPVEDRLLQPDEVRVAVAFGGICGSDLRYFHRGAVGDFALREPMALGHEISGRVVECGSAVSGMEPRMKAALDPSRPCLTCSYCREGRSNLCANMFFLGSAGRFPHVQGGFAQHLVLRQDQVIPVPPETDLLHLSVAEPLSVGLHAVNRAGRLLGKRVLVSGSGPIGLLTARAAALAGASAVVSTDIEDAPLAVATGQMGATSAVNVAADPEGLARLAREEGEFDVAFEASGSQAALQSLFPMMRRGGRIVQVGMMPPGTAPVPINMLQSREIELVGAFRAHDEFRLAVDLIVRGVVDVTPILSGTYPLAEAATALERAGDRSQVVKLHLAVGGAALMLTRTAVFEGTFGPAGGDRFFQLVEERLAPLWRQFPHALDVRRFRLSERDEAARPIVLIQQIDYPSRAAMAEALASAVRDQARAVTMELMEHLDGTFYHYVSDEGPR